MISIRLVTVVFAALAVLGAICSPASAQDAPVPPGSGPSAPCDQSKLVIATYRIVDHTTLDHAWGGDCAEARAIWDRYVELVPLQHRQMLTRFQVLHPDLAGGEVYQSYNAANWTLGISLGLGRDLDYILIHEFAHLFTLKASEVPPVHGGGRAARRAEAACTTYFSGEGCARPGSLIARYMNRFWDADLLARLQAGEPLIDTYPFRFVTDYAATDPGEDIAESFATFVTYKRSGAPTIAGAKLRFFWNKPPLVKLRNHIRRVIAEG